MAAQRHDAGVLVLGEPELSVQGVTLGLLADCGVLPPSPRLDQAGREEWLCGALQTLRHRDMAIQTLRGVLLRVALVWKAWEGRSQTWSGFCAQYAGLSKSEASRLMTISDVLMRGVGMTADEIVSVGDTTKMYSVAAAGRRALDDASEEDRGGVIDAIRTVAREAGELSRSDVIARMGDVGMRAEDTCLEPRYQRICGKTGEIGATTCAYCAQGERCQQ